MEWFDFCDNYTQWAESTLRSRIASLKELGSADEIVNVVYDLPTEKLKAQLVNKAIRCGVTFSQDDFMNLDGELPEEVYRALAAHAGFDAENPYFDENNMTWDDFYGDYSEWEEALLLRRIGKLKDFGDPEEVCDVINDMPSFACADALYESAVAHKVSFTQAQLEEMGRGKIDLIEAINNFCSDEDLKQVQKNVAIVCDELDRLEKRQKRKPRRGFFGGFLFGLLLFLGGRRKR